MLDLHLRTMRGGKKTNSKSHLDLVVFQNKAVWRGDVRINHVQYSEIHVFFFLRGTYKRGQVRLARCLSALRLH